MKREYEQGSRQRVGNTVYIFFFGGEGVATLLKSVNLEYNTLVRWVNDHVINQAYDVPSTFFYNFL